MIGPCTVPFRTRLSVALASAIVAILSGRAAFSDPPKGQPKEWLGDWARRKPMVPRGYVCYRAAEAPNIDGRLDEERPPSYGLTTFSLPS
jgi:hypothetical protein